jgi:molecular chaperone DnaJ
MRRDYYAVLGIAATAGPREVRRAYQRLARQYSPDVNFWDERAR